VALDKEKNPCEYSRLSNKNQEAMPGGKSLFFNTMIPPGGNPPPMARGGELLSDLALCPSFSPTALSRRWRYQQEYSKHLAEAFNKIPFDVGQYASMVSAFSSTRQG
jgi:hypothetical protein